MKRRLWCTLCGRGRGRGGLTLASRMLSMGQTRTKPAVASDTMKWFLFPEGPVVYVPPTPLSLSALREMGLMLMLLLNWREHYFFFSFVSNNCKKSCTFFLRKTKNKGPNKTEQCYCILKKYFYRLIFRLLSGKETDAPLFLK